MENKIMFLILALLCLYIVFTPSGQKWLRRYVGIEIIPNNGAPQAPATPDSAGNLISGGGVTA